MDLVKFSMVEAYLAGEDENALPSKSRKHKSIVYVGTGMRGTRYIFASNDEYTKHLLTIKSSWLHSDMTQSLGCIIQDSRC